VQSVDVGPIKPAADFAKTKVFDRQVIIHVDGKRMYKTDRPDEGEIVVQLTEQVGAASPARTVLDPGDTALLFLSHISATTYEFGDRFLGVTRFAAVPSQVHGPGLSGLESDLALLALSGNKEDCLNALRLLQGFDSLTQDSLAKVAGLSSSKDPELAFASLAILLKTGTPSAVEKLRRYLQTYRGDSQPISLVSISAELGQFTDEVALEDVEALASSRYQGIRYGAMQSLRKMKNVRSIPVIVRRLDDSDSTVQYLAVISLAEMVGKCDGDFAPTMYLFDNKPQYYTSLWKKWWEEEGKSRYAAKPQN
jgi:hypothetical protein